MAVAGDKIEPWYWQDDCFKLDPESPLGLWFDNFLWTSFQMWAVLQKLSFNSKSIMFLGTTLNLWSSAHLCMLRICGPTYMDHERILTTWFSMTFAVISRSFWEDLTQTCEAESKSLFASTHPIDEIQEEAPAFFYLNSQGIILPVLWKFYSVHAMRSSWNRNDHWMQTPNFSEFMCQNRSLSKKHFATCLKFCRVQGECLQAMLQILT